MTGAPRYTGPAIALHWLLAVLLTGSFAVGLWMADLPVSPTRLRVFSWHKWAGVTILALTLLRLAWRLAHAPPPDLPMPRWQARLAHAVHAGMLLFSVGVPVLGWIYSSAAGFPVAWFGVLPLPDLVSPDKQLAEALKPWHGRAAWMLAMLVVLHLGGVLRHLFSDGWAIVYRMLPIGR